ncbi:MAG: VCBS repeat-containing protein [Nanoarchaeota archaeon]|nr:VCBS repeat-containing protein [Nanoarchaeota archaeon]MBU1631825.1 VCBS repeat-containing protein [Nanoarchaeota archaeon]MBU1876149.1 VCBS repeat-containing protein [Nanoarchaeota archaeon]
MKKRLIIIILIVSAFFIFLVQAQQCVEDIDCGQEEICSEGMCVPAQPLEQELSEEIGQCPDDCNDDDPCTEDWCEKGECMHAWNPQCDKEEIKEKFDEEEKVFEEECERFVDNNDCEVRECNGKIVERVCPGENDKEEREEKIKKEETKEEKLVKELPPEITKKLNAEIKSVKADEEKEEYLVEGTRKVKLFGIFSIEEKIKLKVSFKTGEVISVKKPWWDFIASEPKPDLDDDGFTVAKGDCDDNDAKINPSVTEICDNKDNNCNAQTDESCDDDNDNYCEASKTTVGTPPICSKGGGDCNDNNVNIYPTATELCDSIDNDCDGSIDEGCDDDSDNFCESGKTIVGTPPICPNGGNDCNDNNAKINPSATEICDNKDNNCNAQTDEGCDVDNDDYCVIGISSLCPKGSNDCNDNNANIYPAATELCDSIDNDCDGSVDEGCANLSASISKNDSANFTGSFDFLAKENDFNNDGYMDIILRKQTGNLGIHGWLMNSNNIIENKVVAESISSQFEVVGTGDFNGDKKTDLLFYNTNTGILYIWLMNGLQYSSVEEIKFNGGSIPISPANWEFSGIGDFNNDGNADILWRQKTGSMGVYGWIMNDFNIIENKAIAESIGPAFEITGTGDFNGDKKTDLLFHNTNTGILYIWFMDGLNYTSTEEVKFNGASIPLSTDWEFSGIGDFNKDGKADILWRQKTGSRSVYGWTMNDYNIIENKAIAESIGSTFEIIGVGNFNKDGKTDVLFHNSNTGKLHIWFMDGLKYTSTEEVKLNGTPISIFS